MQCDWVIRELSAPGAFDHSVLDEHLIGCSSCASWAAKMEKLDKIWEATRPAEPSALVFDTLWSQIATKADQPSVLTFAPRLVWKKWGLQMAAAAQAAAILIGALYLLSKPTPVVASVTSVTAEEGKTLFVALRDGRAPSVVENPQLSESDTDTVSVDFDILGYMESIR